MALSFRSNGNTSQNQITASWFNDFYNLFTGVMTDQKVTFANTFVIKAIGPSPSAGANGTLASGSNLGIGAYVYVYTYANADGETKISPVFNITTTSGNQKVNLTGISIGATGTTKRNIYRTAVGGGTVYKFLASINNNVATTYSDTIADGSLGAASPTTFTFGGTIILEDSTGVPTFKVTNDGNLTGLGNFSLSGTATLGDLVTSGKIGMTTAGDMFDWSGGADVFIKGFSGNKIQLQIPDGTNIANFSATGLQFNTTGAQKIVDHNANAILDASAGTNLALTAPSGNIKLNNNTDITGAFNAGSNTITSGAINASGQISSSNSMNITGGSYSMLLNGLSRVNFFQQTVSTTPTAYNHGLGAQPDIVLLSLTGTSATAHNTYWSSLNSTQVTLTGDGNNPTWVFVAAY
jgi:hypothetical protein